MTHREIEERGHKWLKNSLNCRVALIEPSAFTRSREIPDVIGWQHNKCILLEVKTSVSDFRNDQKKRSRRSRKYALGDWRIYLTPPNLLENQEIPEGWSWYVVKGNGIHHAGGRKYENAVHRPFCSDARSERAILVSYIYKRELETNGKLRYQGGKDEKVYPSPSPDT